MSIAHSIAFVAALFTGHLAAQAATNEPQYCQLNNFLKHEVSSAPDIIRSRAFRFGDVTILAGAIGKSDVQKIARNAYSHAQVPNALKTERYCTWYFNDRNDLAEKTFNHVYVPNPTDITIALGLSPAYGMYALEEMAKTYEAQITPIFNRNPNSLMRCLQNQKYVAFGCHGQEHRGPTVFAMMLAFSGCSPRSSVDIAVALWGKNWVLNSTRYWIARKAYDQGGLHAEERATWQRLFNQP